jgi:hypothetical protein
MNEVIKELVKWAEKQQYLVYINNEPVLTAKFYREHRVEKELSPKQISNELTRPTTYTNDLKEIWNAFIVDADIPWRVSDNKGGQYTIRQYSKGVAKRLSTIISDPKVDYKRLVDSTKQYYKTVTYKNLLSNYIDKEIWKDAYENYKENSIIPVNDGSSPWESE